MRDNLIEDLAKITSNALDTVDKVNKKLVTIIIIQSIAIIIIVLGIVAIKDGFYFLSDYQYPEVTQESSQTTSQQNQQKVKQEIKKGDNR